MTMVYGRYIELLTMVYKPTFTSAWGWGTTLWVWYALSQGFFFGGPMYRSRPRWPSTPKGYTAPTELQPFRALPRSQRGLQFDPTCQHLWRLRILTFVDTCWKMILV